MYWHRSFPRKSKTEKNHTITAQKYLSIYSILNIKAHLLNGIKILNKNIVVY